MPAKRERHPNGQMLEAYLLALLPRRKAEPIEEHLLVCSKCVETSKELEDYIRSMRSALGTEKGKIAIVSKR